MRITQTFWSKKAARLLFSVAVLLVGTAAVRGQSADSFDPNANDSVSVVVVQPDGKILIGGYFTTLSPNGGPAVTRNYIARLNPDGTLDTIFDPNANGVVWSIAVQPNDKILVGGSFTSIGGQPRNNIARLDATSGLADSFDPNANAGVRAIVIAADGKILAGGDFSNIGGQNRDHVARLDSTSGLADAFDPQTLGLGETVRAIVLLPDGTILAGGFYYRRSGMRRLDPSTGEMLFPFPNPDAIVNAIGLRASGEILVGGTFHYPRNYVAEFNATTFELGSFDPGANGWGVYSMVLQPNGDVLVGGEFTSIGGQPRNNIVRLDPITGLADRWDPNANNIVSSIVVQSDGRILVGGGFTIIGGEARNNIARLDATAPVGSFVIGDVDAVVGARVYFWGSQWAAHNHLSHGSAPSAFKGFANSIGDSTPTCGALWRSDPENSSSPPSTVPTFITVIASSSVTKSGSVITGNDRKIVVVRPDLGYGPSPGHAGTGVVMSVSCE